MVALSRRAYAELYGPTKGDLVRLADTELFAEIEHDFTTYGHELLIGAGKNLRDGEAIAGHRTAADKILDVVVKNATIIDAVAGIIKADMVVGSTTSPVQGHHFIVTAGAVESHAHLISPEQSDHALAGGATTMI